jgi:hypothetical protein
MIGRQSGKCSISNEFITIKNKKTGEIEKITLGEFFTKMKNSPK